MDEFFDHKGAGEFTKFQIMQRLTCVAAETLEEFASTRRYALGQRDEVSVMHLADIEVDSLNVTEMGAVRKNWRLCVPKTEDDVTDEAVIKVQGVVTRANLVPKNINACPIAKVIHLSQHVEICGLDTVTFDAAMLKVDEVYERFQEHLAGADIPAARACSPSIIGKVFNASNRIFTFKSDAPTEQHSEFQFGVDALKKLDKLRIKTKTVIHAPDNIVKYYQRATDRHDNVRYLGSIPGAFKPGDVVELEVSFVAMKAEQNSVKVTTRLHSVTMLSNEYSKRATAARAVVASKSVIYPAVQRKIGQFHDDGEDERKLKKTRTEGPEAEAMQT
ncbi:hypothetical protein C8R44DRAFT_880931 [Mycena epipterygia]|nr:hypothetical protein C8R44DRAFT_880931 [Mycena epipterygia]